MGRPHGRHFRRICRRLVVIPQIDPCTLPPAALDANSATGDGYGGAILCDNGSPTISYCVIENCTVTGALGGTGASGQSGTWYYYTWADFNWEPGPTYQELLDTATLKNTTNGQGAGNGGNGIGTGFGGAIAVKNGSPIISNCHFLNNSAQGGQGGNGGRGGNAADPPDYSSGLEGGGGNAGQSIGSGVGGAIWVAAGSGTGNQPTITACRFEGNIAKTGPRASRGGRGFGNVNVTNNNRITAGFSGEVMAGGDPNPGIAGGAAYFESGASVIITDCNFIANKAYVAFGGDPLDRLVNPVGYPTYPAGYEEDIAGYTAGGALYFKGNNVALIHTCDFINNGGGALYFGQGCNYIIDNQSAIDRGQPGRKNLFQGNTAPDDVISQSGIITDGGSWFIGYSSTVRVPSSGSGGAIYISSGNNSTYSISDCVFNENRAKVNGGAIESQSNVAINNCAFSGNMADGSTGNFTGFGGAMDVYIGTSTLSINATNCSFTGNQSVWGGAVSSEEFNANFSNCFFINNKAEISGALDLSLGSASIADSVFKGNIATGGDGGGINCRYSFLDVQSCEFFNNSADGTFASGGAIDIDGQSGSGHQL